MALTVSPGPLTTDARVHLLASPYGICGGESSTEPGFSLSVLIFPFQYYSTNSPHPFIHLTLTLYVLSNCQCREMKRPSKMYKMRLKNLRTLNFIKSLITSKICYTAARNLSYICNWLLGGVKIFVADYSS